MNTVPDLVLFLGRLHPLLVHLPVALLMLLVLLELAARGEMREAIAPARRLTLRLAAIGAAFSAVFGWLLARGGGYDGALLAQHRNLGFVTAGLALALLLLHRARHPVWYRLGVVAACAVMIWASHLGGSLTHGAGYLTAHLPAPIRRALGLAEARPAAPFDPATAPVFAGAVQPVLRDRCVECHNGIRLQGGLRLDTLEGLRKGGSEGPALVPGRADESRLVRRLLLPEGDEKRMPPAGRSPATDDELAILRWWIDAGAPVTQTVAEARPPGRVLSAMSARLGGAAVRAAAPRPLAEVEPEAARLAGETGALVAPLARTEPWLEVNASFAGTNFGNAHLALLRPVAANVRRLDLGGTAVTDEGLACLPAFANLQALHLPRTSVTDAGLTNLAALAGLEILNLYGTTVTDAGLESLKPLPHLQRVYLWQTEVTPVAATRLAAELTDTNRIARMQREVESLQARIRAARIEVNVGAEADAAPTNAAPAAAAPAASAAAPVNTVCPVKGTPVDPTITFVHEGRTIAFCCVKCCAAFQKNPAAYLAKLPPAAK